MGRVFFNTRKDVHALDGAYTMLESDSGTTFMLSATGGTVAITMLPIASIVEGWNCKFVVDENTPSNVTTINAATAIVCLVHKDAAGDAANSSIGTQKTTIVIGETCTKGDYVNLFCDGTSYYAESLSGVGDAITTG